MADDKYLHIVRQCEKYLGEHGDTCQGVGWPKEEDAGARYRVMLDVIRDRSRKNTLLDLGCGCSHFLDFIKKNGITGIEYSGLDLSDKFLELSRAKYPHVTYYKADILSQDLAARFDYVIMNGIFTQKVDLSFDEMLGYFKKMIPKAFAICDEGVAFNVMAKQVDWERDDLFHLPLSTLAEFLAGEVSRHFVIRHDYGLYEYTVYLYKRPSRQLL